MEYVIIGAVAVGIIMLLRGSLVSLSKKPKKNAVSAPVHSSTSASPPVCPVCRSPLPKGVDLFTKVFRPMTVHDQHCVVFGCPRCYTPNSPLKLQGIDRRCPVCHAEVPQNSYLIARLFNQTKNGKKHLTVTGCPKCARAGGD